MPSESERNGTLELGRQRQEADDSVYQSIVEDAALAWLGALGYTLLHGPDIARPSRRGAAT